MKPILIFALTLAYAGPASAKSVAEQLSEPKEQAKFVRLFNKIIKENNQKYDRFQQLLECDKNGEFEPTDLGTYEELQERIVHRDPAKSFAEIADEYKSLEGVRRLHTERNTEGDASSYIYSKLVDCRRAAKKTAD